MQLKRLRFYPSANGLRPQLFFGLCLILAAGCAIVGIDTEKPKGTPSGKNPPTLDKVFAASQISPGDTWKIYLKGADPDGDLSFIHVWAGLSFRAGTPFRFPIHQDQGTRVSGYLDLNTSQLGTGIAPSYIRVQLTLEDRSGLRSEGLILSTELFSGARQEGPPPSSFEDRFLGRIPVETIPRGAGPGL